jgi:hypothetical protein
LPQMSGRIGGRYELTPTRRPREDILSAEAECVTP